MGKRFSSMFMVLSGSLLLLSPSGKQAIAQAQQPPCQPPSVGEYLLMVVHQTPDTQAALQETLPRNAVTTVCDYLGSTVTRVSGFTDLEVANSWAQYLSDLGGLQAFVARPASEASASPSQTPTPTAISPTEPVSAESFPAPTADSSSTTEDPSSTASSTAVDLVEPFPTPTQVAPATPTAPSSLGVSPVTPTPSPSPTNSSPGNVAIATSPYNPRPLGAGYAVLVDYGSRPEVAADIRQVVAAQVGVVAYEQRPYLLASYTSDLATAAAVLQQLSDRNFSAILVDSRRAILLAPTVAND